MLADDYGKPVAQRCPMCPPFNRVRRAPRQFAGNRLQLAGHLSWTATFPRSIAS